MPEEGFLRRWARVKASGGEAVAEAPCPAPAAPAAPPAAFATVEAPRPAAPAGDSAQAALTLEDAARLTPASDFSAFVSQGVDKDVRRLALKKLFADPHFHVMDRLDMYMDDYNKPDPVSATMLAALEHARGALRRPEEVQAELARLAARDAPPAAATDAPAHEQAEVQLPAAQAGSAQEQGAGELVSGATAADTPLRPGPPAGMPLAAAPVAHPLPASSMEAAGDTIALPSQRAQNAEASP